MVSQRTLDQPLDRDAQRAETGASRRGPVAAIVRVVGALLVVGGGVLVLWGFVTWQWGDPATGLYTTFEQRRLAGEYERVVRAYEPPDPGTPSDVPRTARRYRTSLTEGQAVGRISVERLGVDLTMVYGTSSATLRTGPGVDPRAFVPGEGELVYIAGHRTTFGAPFAHIDRLRRGDRVVLDVPYGRFVYAVTETVIVPADDLARLDSRGREEVALQACHPRFSARQRLIVYAQPVGEAP